MNRLALNTITIRQEPDARQQVEIAARAGFEGIGLWADVLGNYEAAGGSLAALRKRLKDAGLFVAEVCFAGGWMYPEPERRGEAFAAARDVFRKAAEVGSETAICCADCDAGAKSEAVRNWNEICAIGEAYGVKAALEFIGPAEQFKDLDSAYAVVEGSGNPMGGILLDTFHFHRGGSSVASLGSRVPASAIALVHVNDFPDGPAQELTDLDRVYPGDGGENLAPILRAILGNGYSGAFSLEIFNEDYWAQDPAEVAEEGRRKLESFLSKL